ncbi:MAG: hypothetical protein D3923_09075 [Candidatus Electrothrix sp. AR3]|nr:hypothetical protein [Candidatus Electrothrix sp. AR3]
MHGIDLVTGLKKLPCCKGTGCVGYPARGQLVTYGYDFSDHSLMPCIIYLFLFSTAQVQSCLLYHKLKGKVNENNEEKTMKKHRLLMP